MASSSTTGPRSERGACPSGGYEYSDPRTSDDDADEEDDDDDYDDDDDDDDDEPLEVPLLPEITQPLHGPLLVT